MSQAELFPVPTLVADALNSSTTSNSSPDDSPAAATVKDSLQVQVPTHYLDLHGMSIVRKPVLMWLVDAIVEALTDGPVLSRELWRRVGLPVQPSTLSRHLCLAVDLGLVMIDYRFDEPRNAGRSDPAVVELVEDGG